MIDLMEVNAEIEKLECSDLSYQNATKLAVLYSLRDHNKGSNLKGNYFSNYSYGQSEFLQVCADTPIDDIMSVLDEHMECIKLLYPKEYRNIIKRLKK